MELFTIDIKIRYFEFNNVFALVSIFRYYYKSYSTHAERWREIESKFSHTDIYFIFALFRNVRITFKSKIFKWIHYKTRRVRIYSEQSKHQFLVVAQIQTNLLLDKANGNFSLQSYKSILHIKCVSTKIIPPITLFVAEVHENFDTTTKN